MPPKKQKMVVGQVGSSKTIKIMNGQNVADQIKDLEAIVQAKSQIRNNLIVDQGGEALQAEFFEKAAAPITRAVGRSRDEVIQEKLDMGIPLTRSEQAYFTEKRGDIESGPAPDYEAGPAPPPPQGTEIFTGPVRELRKLGSPAFRDVDESLLSVTKKGNQFFINNRSVEIVQDLTDPNLIYVDGKLLTTGLANLLFTRLNNKGIQYTDTDVDNYKDILGPTGVAHLKTATSFKASNLKSSIQGWGRKQPRLKKTHASRIVDGKFGEMTVNTKRLKDGIVELHGADKKIALVRPVTQGVVYLMTSHATSSRAGSKFTADDLKVYHEIAKAAGAYIAPHTNRAKMMGEGVAKAVFIEKDPKRMAERLDVLVGLREGGSKSVDDTNEAMVLADALLRTRHLSKANHKEIFDIFMA